MVKSLSKNCAKMLLVCMIFLTNSWGQEISVPEENILGSKIIATVTNAPVGSILWSAQNLEVESSNEKLFIWGKAGTYQINCIIIPLKRVTVGDQTFDVINGDIKRLDKTFKIIGSAPEPEPDPVTNVPFETPGLAVIVFKEAKDLLPLSQRNILSSPKFIKWCTDNCVKINNLPAFRIWDDDYTPDMFANSSPILKNAYFKLLPKVKTPWLAVSNGKKGFSGPLPQNIDETLALLEKYK